MQPPAAQPEDLEQDGLTPEEREEIEEVAELIAEEKRRDLLGLPALPRPRGPGQGLRSDACDREFYAGFLPMMAYGAQTKSATAVVGPSEIELDDELNEAQRIETDEGAFLTRLVTTQKLPLVGGVHQQMRRGRKLEELAAQVGECEAVESNVAMVAPRAKIVRELLHLGCGSLRDLRVAPKAPYDYLDVFVFARGSLVWRLLPIPPMAPEREPPPRWLRVLRTVWESRWLRPLRTLLQPHLERSDASFARAWLEHRRLVALHRARLVEEVNRALGRRGDDARTFLRLHVGFVIPSSGGDTSRDAGIVQRGFARLMLENQPELMERIDWRSAKPQLQVVVWAAGYTSVMEIRVGAVAGGGGGRKRVPRKVRAVRMEPPVTMEA